MTPRLTTEDLATLKRDAEQAIERPTGKYLALFPEAVLALVEEVIASRQLVQERAKRWQSGGRHE